MIDRTRRLPPFTAQYYRVVTLIAAFAWIAAPTLALAAELLGLIGMGLLWLGHTAVFLLHWAAVLAGWAAVVIGLLICLGGSKREDGCGAIVLGAIGLVAASVLGGLSNTTRGLADTWGPLSTGWGWEWATYLVRDVWLGWGLVGWCWLPVAGAAAVSGAMLGVIGLLRAHDRLVRSVGRIHLACPDGHRSGAAFACPNCGEWEADLAPSVHGIVTARCRCGERLPTCHLAGRTRLARRCRICDRALDHPDLGTRPEVHVAVWCESAPVADRWLAETLGAAARSGGHVLPEPSGPSRHRGSALPASMVSLGGPGLRLLYLYRLVHDPGETPPGGPTNNYQRWLDGTILVLPDTPDRLAQDRAVPSLLELWDRLRPGRARGRHRSSIAVVAAGQTPRPGPPESPGAEGPGRLLLTLESRFRLVRYFPPATDPLSPLDWLDQVL